MTECHRPTRLVIQGATGSIGRSTLDVVRAHRDRFEIVGVAAGRSAYRLLEIAREFGVTSVALSDPGGWPQFETDARQAGIGQILVGETAATKQVAFCECDLLVSAMLGSVGLEPTHEALRRGVSVALANKETLVAAGPLIMQAARAGSARIIPIDSEHSAIYQCLQGENPATIRKIWLTTSGGPFWGRSRKDLASVTPEEALRHPTWRMGDKITVDSATLFNKGLEIIEAAGLFGVGPDEIGVVCHRQSVVHSLVEFSDGSIKAQLSTPDMRLPILYALGYPARVTSHLVDTPMDRLPSLTFEPVPWEEFPCLQLALEALRRGGTAPAALSAADEVAVQAFLDRRIGFNDIADVLQDVLEDWKDEALTDLEIVRHADRSARRKAEETVVKRMTRKVLGSCY